MRFSQFCLPCQFPFQSNREYDFYCHLLFVKSNYGGLFTEIFLVLNRETLKEVLMILRNTANPQVEYIVRTMKKWGKEQRMNLQWSLCRFGVSASVLFRKCFCETRSTFLSPKWRALILLCSTNFKCVLVSITVYFCKLEIHTFINDKVR